MSILLLLLFVEFYEEFGMWMTFNEVQIHRGLHSSFLDIVWLT